MSREIVSTIYGDIELDSLPRITIEKSSDRNTTIVLFFGLIVMLMALLLYSCEEIINCKCFVKDSNILYRNLVKEEPKLQYFNSKIDEMKNVSDGLVGVKTIFISSGGELNVDHVDLFTDDYKVFTFYRTTKNNKEFIIDLNTPLNLREMTLSSSLKIKNIPRNVNVLVRNSQGDKIYDSLHVFPVQRRNSVVFYKLKEIPDFINNRYKLSSQNFSC